MHGDSDSIGGDSLLVSLSSKISWQKDFPVGVTSYQCNLCNKSFLYACDLFVHGKIHHRNEKMFSCQCCGKAYRYKQGLQDHLHTHSDKKPNSCPFCDKVCVYRAKLQEHMRTHTGEKPFKCKYCDASFCLRNEVLSHENFRHLRKHNFSCQECGKIFTSKRSLLTHLGSGDHTGEEYCTCCDCITKYKHCDSSGNMLYACKCCATLYQTTCSLRKHLREKYSFHRCRTESRNCCCRYCIMKCRISSASESTWYICRDCDSLFTTAFSLMQHLKSRIEIQNCNICGQVFCNEWHQLCHAARTHGHLTKVSFISTEDLQTNSQHQASELPYFCMYCMTTFAVRDELLFHTQGHIIGMPFECMFCIRTFKSDFLCRKHEAFHAIKGPYICWYCKEEFPVRKQLLKHMRKHYRILDKSRRILKCRVCHKSFFHPRALHHHVDIFHSGNPESLARHNKEACINVGYKCMDYDKSFTRESYLGKHERSHMNVNHYVCMHCKSRFPSRDQLILHMQGHCTETEPKSTPIDTKCRHGDSEFKKDLARSSLARNQCKKSLNGEICGESFSTLAQLKVHMFMHAQK